MQKVLNLVVFKKIKHPLLGDPLIRLKMSKHAIAVIGTDSDHDIADRNIKLSSHFLEKYSKNCLKRPLKQRPKNRFSRPIIA